MERQELEKRMDRIIEWVKVCDTKTSILLSALSVLLTITFTSDVIVNHISDLALRMFDKHYYSYDGICVLGLLSLFALLLSCFFALWSGYSFMKVLYAKKNEEQFGNEHYTESLIHFRHISSLAYEDFTGEIQNYNDNKWELDLLSQIHINAMRCNEKFDDYNAGVKWFAVSLSCGLATVVLFSIYFMLY